MSAIFKMWFDYTSCLIWPLGALVVIFVLVDSRGPWLELGSIQMVGLSLLLFCALEIAKRVPVYRQPIVEWRYAVKFVDENRRTAMWFSLDMAVNAFFSFNMVLMLREHWPQLGFWTPNTSLPLFSIFLATMALLYVATYIGILRRILRERTKPVRPDSTPTSA